jgi:hypothetical protein
MAESPEAEARLLKLEPDEVSGVGMPAIGEPHFVMKGMEKEDAAVATKPKTKKVRKVLLDTTQVPRPVMKAVQTRLQHAQVSLAELHDVAKGLMVEDGMTSKEAPTFLVEMTKSVAAELRSLQPDESVPVAKRARAASVMSLRAISKQLEEREKSNAVSYLVRDEYVSVTSSVSEYLSTYVDGIETDDNGPMLIPGGLDETIDKTAGPLEEVVAQYEDEPVPDKTPQEAPTTKNAEPDLGSIVERLEKVAAGLTTKETDMTEDTIPTDEATDEPAATDGTSDEGTPESTPEPTPEDAPTPEPAPAPESAAEPVEKDAVLKAIEVLSAKVDARFEEVEKKVEEVRGEAKGAKQDVEKALRTRSDANGGGPKGTTKVAKGKDESDEGDFSNVLGIPKTPRGDSE